MNVALLLDRFESAGSEQAVRRLALGLAARGRGVHVYCLKASDEGLTELRLAGIVARVISRGPRDWGLPVRLTRWLSHDAIDIVHTHTCSGLVWAFGPARLLGLPLVHVRHGWPLGRRHWTTIAADRLDAWVDRVAINCEAGRARLPTGRVAQRAVHVPNGIDAIAANPAEARAELAAVCGRTPPRPAIMSIGNFRAEKDAVTLLRAFALLSERWPTASLVCVGGVHTESYWREVRATVDDLGLSERVLFPGSVRGAARLLPAADVFCLSSCQEAMPNVVLEAMAARTPIVATTVGDVGRLDGSADAAHWVLRDGKTALLAPPRDPQRLADALAHALQAPTAAAARAERAHARYRSRYTTEQMVARYDALYAACAKGRRRPRGGAAARVVMLGPAPPAVGGMATSVSLLMRSPLRDAFHLTRLGTARPTGERCGLLRPFVSAWRHTAALARLAYAVRIGRVDVLHIHTCSYFTFFRNVVDMLAAQALGARVVLHIRGGRFAEFCAQSRFRRVIRWALRRAEAVVVLSRRHADELRPHAPRARIEIVPNAFDPQMRQPPRAAHDGPCRFVYVGELRAAKGVGELLTAATTLRAGGVSFRLTLAGPGDDAQRRRWTRVIANAQLESHVALRGPVHGDEKRALLAGADCFVHPSHSEGLPNAVLEAAAAGLPVIATDVGATALALTDPNDGTPLSPLVPAKDAAALATAMRTLAENPQRRAETAQRLHAHVTTHFDLAATAARLADIYRTLVSPPSLERQGDEGRAFGGEADHAPGEARPAVQFDSAAELALDAVEVGEFGEQLFGRRDA